MSIHRLFAFSVLLFAAAALWGLAGPALAGDITAKMQPKIDTYKKQAAAWAADPQIVNAVKEANAKGPIEGMGNAKWRELKETDPLVQGFVTNPTGQLLTKWMSADAHVPASNVDVIYRASRTSRLLLRAPVRTWLKPLPPPSSAGRTFFPIRAA